MTQTGKKYWRSLDELADTPSFREWLHREFPHNASEMLDGSSRRTLLKLMAASIGLAGLSACRRPVDKILPASKAIDEYTPGVPVFYATAMSLGGVATGLLAEASDGRPTKIEGNEKHPASLGAAGGFAQASILNLYDPDRQQRPMLGTERRSWADFLQFAGPLFDPARSNGGAGLRFLSETINSPSFEAVKAFALQKLPNAKWVEYDPISQDEVLAGAELAFGQRLQPVYRFDKADVIVSLDFDFLNLDSPVVRYTKDFSKRRRVSSAQDTLNRLYAVESQFSVTGGMADHRLRVRNSDVPGFAAELATALKVLSGGLMVLNSGDERRRKTVAAIAKDLEQSRGKSLVVAGPRQPAVVQALAFWMNQALGNMGQTLTFVKPANPGAGQVKALKELASEMAAGKVDTLLILGGNPAFNAPSDLDFAANLKKTANTIHLTSEPNETSALVKWTLPETHYLEAWGDARAYDGTVSIQQPLIEPLYEGKSAVELVAELAGYKDQRGYAIVRNYWLSQWGGKEQNWRPSLHDGVIPGTTYPPVNVSVNAAAISQGVSAKAASGGDMEIVFVLSSHAYDGRFANNGWLQECPDPTTKATWDNVAAMSIATAKSLGVETGDLVAIERNGRKIEVPALIQPGHGDRSISLALGHGRTTCGRVGKGVGHNVYPLRTSDALHCASGVTVNKTGRKYSLSFTQEHSSMEGRALVREASLEEYRKHPDVIKEMGETSSLSLYKEPYSYEKGHQWGMSIDLSSCVGCNACLIACQAENNIPIVGKDQVARGREMHWIRLDRYYVGPAEDPQMVYEPMACVQCEAAPCENVCPVGATIHSEEGLNMMTYNRCVGTRYCSNNCPYKVRRFNFLNWHKETQEVEKMAFNPDVTVRMRGVMEKCTYCVQRIQEAKIKAKTDGRRPLHDGEILTACQQTCPADAIVFGDVNDPNSRVSQVKKQQRDYAVLGELGTKPRTTYLAKLRNPNPELA